MISADIYAQAAAESSDISEYLPLLRSEVASRPHAVVVELGVRNGYSTAAFLAGVDDADGSLWSYDLNPPGRHAATLTTHPRWTFTQGSGIDPTIIRGAPPHVDVLFIDTLHTYALTLTELTTWAPRVRAGGVILLHDTALEDPATTDPSLASEPTPFPVRQAAHDFMRSNQHDWTWAEVPGQYGLGVMRRA